MGVKHIVILAATISVARTMMIHPKNLSMTEVIHTTDEELENSTIASNETLDKYKHLTKEFLNCLKITLEPGEYTILDNNTLYAHVYANSTWKVLFEYGNYYIDDKNAAVICMYSSFIEGEAKDPINIVQAYVTVIGLSISLFCLLFHFITFLLVPEMKNLPGKNLASLTVALFIAYTLFLVGNTEFHKKPACGIIGVCIYYFMMASFFWMSAISFDIFKSVRMAIKKLRKLSKSEEQKWFIAYSLYSWAVPAIFTAIVVAGDLIPFLPNDFRPKFDDNLCWFSHRLAIIAFFATPLGILMLGNVVFFVMSATIIFSNSIKREEPAKRLKKNLILNLKLAVIMGFVWITDLVAGIVDNDYLWCIFLSMTVLQGMFIFIAFTRFKKARSCFREKVSSAISTIHGSTFFISSKTLHIVRNGTTH